MTNYKTVLYKEISSLGKSERAFVCSFIDLMVSYERLFPDRSADWEAVIHILFPETRTEEQ